MEQPVEYNDYSDTKEAIHPKGSPLWPKHLAELYIKPTKFFAGQLALHKTPYLLFVTWCYGISHSIGRLNKDMFRALMERPTFPGYFGPWTESWLAYWANVFVYGIAAALGVWFVGGWWYRVRVRWSGSKNPDIKLARQVYIYASFVHACPIVLIALISTVLYPSYSTAFASVSVFSDIILIFPFWSLVTSYKGVRTLFDVSKWRARLWFLILPALVYIIGLGLFGYFFSVLSQQGL